MTSLIIVFIPVVLIVLLIIIVAALRNDSKGEKDMIKKVYVYIVLFATLMMVIGGSVAAFMAAADIIAPTPYHQSFGEYKRWSTTKDFPEGDERQQVVLSDEELRAEYDALAASYVDNQVARAKNSLLKSLGWIVIPLPVFVFFQRRLSHKEE